MNYFYNGKEVRNFTILKLIGRGSYASVYKVKRNDDGNIYAMKIMDGDRLNKKEKLGLITEINILSKNNNPYLLKFYEVFIENNFFHVIMEYAENKDLKSFIDYRKSKNSPLSYNSINKLFYQLCQGVKYLHDHNVIHRDLKPANIMVTKNFDLKIGDFGISKVFTDYNKFAVTQIGSPLYMSPEVLGNCKYCYKTDIWALGCILYELFTFEPVFNARSLPELYRIIRIAKFDKRKIRNHSYLNLINKMLLVDQNSRPNIEYVLNNIPNLENEEKVLDKTCNKILPALIIPKNKYQWDDILPKPAYSPVNIIKKNISEPVLINKNVSESNVSKFDAPIFRSKSVMDNNIDNENKKELKPLPKVDPYFYKVKPYSKNDVNPYSRNNLKPIDKINPIINNKVDDYNRIKPNYYSRNELKPMDKNELKPIDRNDLNPINRNYVAKYNYYKRRDYNQPINNRYNYPNLNKDNNNIMYNRVANNHLPKIINHADKYLEKEDEKKKFYYKNKMSYGKNYVSPYNQFLIKKDINLMNLRYNKNNYVSEYKDKFKNYN